MAHRSQERQEFDHELTAIDAKVIGLFAMVAADLPKATSALLTGQSEAVVQKLAERDREIDALYPQIEDLADRELVLQQPEASDLRLLISVLRVAPELERSHDLILDIARRASHIPSEVLTPRTRGLIEQMGSLASDMWRQASDCWRQRDRYAALALSESDGVMAELYATLVGEIASGGMTPSVTMEMTLVAWFYKRLADHAFNIARRVVYLAGHLPPRLRDPVDGRNGSALVPGLAAGECTCMCRCGPGQFTRLSHVRKW